MKKLVLYTGRTIAVLKALSDEQAGILFRRLLVYVEGVDDASNDPLVEAMFSVLKVDVDCVLETYNSICERNKANGKKGGRPKKVAETQNNPNNPVGFLETQKTQTNPKKPIIEYNIIEYNKIEDNINNINSVNRVMLSSSDNAVDLVGLANYWNSRLTANNSIMSQIKSISGKRKNSVLARVKENGKEAVKIVIDKATASEFLNGKNDKGWIASFDWIFQHPSNFTKTLEGNYDTKIIGTNASSKQYNSASERVDKILGLCDKSE